MVNDMCIICMENMEDGNLTTLQCGRQYHKTCIDEWWKRKNVESCPVCDRVQYRHVSTTSTIEEYRLFVGVLLFVVAIVVIVQTQ